MKKYLYSFIILFLCLCSTSYIVKPKPHLIVGNWELLENQSKQLLFFKDGEEFSIARITFSSDEIASGFYLIKKGEKIEEKLTLGFKIYEPFEEFKNPVLLLKNLCDGRTRIVFSILKLDKGFLKLKFEKESSSENITIKNEVFDFERTAGPSENMPDSPDAIKFKIDIDKTQKN
jgi:hypothetical protein